MLFSRCCVRCFLGRLCLALLFAGRCVISYNSFLLVLFILQIFSHDKQNFFVKFLFIYLISYVRSLTTVTNDLISSKELNNLFLFNFLPHIVYKILHSPTESITEPIVFIELLFEDKIALIEDSLHFLLKLYLLLIKLRGKLSTDHKKIS